MLTTIVTYLFDAQWHTTAGSLLRSRLRATPSSSTISGPTPSAGTVVLPVSRGSTAAVVEDAPSWLAVVHPTRPIVSVSNPTAMVRRASITRLKRNKSVFVRERTVGASSQSE